MKKWADDFDSKLTGLCGGLYFRKEEERGIKNELKDSDFSVLVANVSVYYNKKA